MSETIGEEGHFAEEGHARCPSFKRGDMNDCRTMDTRTSTEGIVMEKAEVIELSRADEQKALEFLMKQDLTGSIIADIAALGYAGQDRNKLLLYMIATSRKMENPLACIVTGESCWMACLTW